MRALGFALVGFEIGCAYDDFLFTHVGVTYFGTPRELGMLFFAAMLLAVLLLGRTDR